ncbi:MULTISPECIES: ATP-binding cassette domain-containing protein [unclassified Rhizobium]|uniref:branched-chain amino acid ABC transporter ATP-binding protein/permease n=1 Tax=unclassified Rhizobium TaxID=2613769 RepID=UPI00161069AB|nr:MULTISPECIES: ATP-binding cassette domain-containing protein [unclassified Rhizobium]MBB3289064.1 branched-chain amino acid transport system permease protein [Rhizobium sp. BK252]MBB3403806.1 branched-chain amino acid transport system permease protein [Rhizobium sp. BK289]MBB3416525.1 branched-chain amino acid transport system permease protein [Rhizobium sp. BK284]MBB3484269.1 branched-chain amino acid transport system permease protein [Rhizobium sp. BK347]
MKHASLRAALSTALSLVVLGVLVLILLPKYWVFLITAVFIVGITLQSLGLVTGRTGMISLCQMSFAGVGAWVTGYLNLVEAPGGLALWIVVGGLAAVPVGVAIGLPALRLRGINLAIVTLGFAAAFDTVLATITFPGQTTFTQVARPELFDTDRGYFVFVLATYGVIAVALEFVNRSRLGVSWLAIRHSERAAAAHGVSIARAKLSAFAISAFISGMAGGLLAGYLGTLVADNFSMMQSLALFAVATMVGAHLTLGTIIGGAMITLFPELLRRLNLPQDIGNIFFALGAVQALSTGEAIAQTWTRLFGKLLPRRAPQMRVPQAAALPAKAVHKSGNALEIRDLTVRYGAVTALDKVNLAVPAGKVVGLIGPNGAGKSTLVDAIAGFLQRYEGSILLEGNAVDGLSATDRARNGIRRTWQTTRIAPELRVGEYMRLAARTASPSEIEALLAWAGAPSPDTPIAAVDAGTRRLLDVAGVVAARPPIILLDEPAAGVSYDEALKLGERIAAIPATFGSAVLLIEHDMDLVRNACSQITVFDFGRVIANGQPETVLAMPVVQKAYMGVEFGEVAA